METIRKLILKLLNFHVVGKLHSRETALQKEAQAKRLHTLQVDLLVLRYNILTSAYVKTPYRTTSSCLTFSSDEGVGILKVFGCGQFFFAFSLQLLLIICSTVPPK